MPLSSRAWHQQLRASGRARRVERPLEWELVCSLFLRLPYDDGRIALENDEEASDTAGSGQKQLRSTRKTRLANAADVVAFSGCLRGVEEARPPDRVK